MCLAPLWGTLNLKVAMRAGSRKAGTGAFWRVSGYRARATAGSWTPTWAEVNTWNWAEDGTVPWARAGTWTGAGKRAGTGAEVVTRTRQRAVVVAVIELRAWNRALARAVFLSDVPGPSWRWCSVGMWRGQASWNALGGILFTAGRFFPGLLQPLIQLPLGSRGVICLLGARGLCVRG